MIRREIIGRSGSLARFTQELRLRFLLRPVSYDADLAVLRARGDGVEACNFDALRASVAHGAGQLALVVGGAGEGKSTLAAAMIGGVDGGAPAGARFCVDAAHLCKRADAARQDVLAIARSLAYQLARRFEEVSACLLALPAAEVERAQVDAAAAVEVLLVRPLQALGAAGRHAVVLVDALDEADDAHGLNPVLRLLRDLGGAARGAMSLVVTLRPEPEVSQRVLAYAWGEERTLRLVPAQLRAPLMAGGGGGGAAAAAARPIGDERWASALREQAESKIYQIVTRRFALAHAGRGLPPPPRGVNEAYRLWFEHAAPGRGAAAREQLRRLVGVVMAAREPLSSALLEQLGLHEARVGLPGWGLLFEEREHLLQTLHLSLREFLCDDARSGAHAADVRAGHRELAQSCLRTLRARSSGPALAYGARLPWPRPPPHLHASTRVSWFIPSIARV